MDPFFTEEQLNNMSRENMMEVMRIMQNQVQKKETEVQLLKDKQKELEFTFSSQLLLCSLLLCRNIYRYPRVFRVFCELTNPFFIQQSLDDVLQKLPSE